MVLQRMFLTRVLYIVCRRELRNVYLPILAAAWSRFDKAYSVGQPLTSLQETADQFSDGGSALAYLVIGSISFFSGALTYRGNPEADTPNVDELFEGFSALRSASSSDPEHSLIYSAIFDAALIVPPSPGDLDKIRTWSGILQRQGLEIFRLDQDRDFEFLKKYSPEQLKCALACGLKPNGGFYGESCSRFATPILMVLVGVCLLRKESFTQQQLAIDKISLLIRAGADLHQACYRDDNYFEFEASGIPITPTLAATILDIKKQWAAALLNCGYDPKEVFAEDVRRCREFTRTNGAECSGVEISSNPVEESNVLRLRSRRVFEVED